MLFQSTWQELTSHGFQRKKIENALEVCSTPAEVVQILRQEKVREEAQQQAQTSNVKALHLYHMPPNTPTLQGTESALLMCFNSA